MEETLYVGLDIHRKSYTVTILDRKGKQLSQEKLPADDAGLLRHLEKFPGKKRVTLEACSVWEHVYDALGTSGAEVILSHPTETKAISKAKLKSDRVDSEALAELTRLDAVPEAYAPP